MSAKKKGDEKQQPSSGIVLTMFMAFLLIYFLARFVLADRWGVRNQLLAIPLEIALVVFTLVIQFNTFVELSKFHCGEPQIGQVVGYTVMSNLMYMGILIVLLYFFPGFKSPFSNTFGYMAIALKAKEAMNKVIIEKDSKNQLWNEVYQDKSAFINLLSPSTEGFDDVLKKLASDGNMMRPDWDTNKGKLWNLVVIKDYVGQFCWLVLGMALTVSTTFNNILGIENCVNSDAYRNKLAGKVASELAAAKKIKKGSA